MNPKELAPVRIGRRVLDRASGVGGEVQGHGPHGGHLVKWSDGETRWAARDNLSEPRPRLVYWGEVSTYYSGLR